MAIDPSIALAFRSPEITAQPVGPLQLTGQYLSLQNMMRQGQMQELQLQQAQQEWQERMALSQLIQQQYLNPGNAAPATATAMPPAAGGIQPGGIPSLTPQPQPVTVATPTIAPSLAPTLGAWRPTLPDTGTPAFAPPQPAPVAAPAQPMATAASVRPSGEIEMPGMLPHPDFAQWLKVAPTIGPQAIEGYSKAIKSQYDLANAQYTQQENTLKRAAGLANSIVDEPTKFTAVATAYNEGLLNAPERDRLMQVPWNDPIWKSWQQGAMSAAEGAANARANLEEHYKQLEENRKEALFGPQLSEAQSKAATARITVGQDQLSSDAQMLSAAAARGPDAVAAIKAQIGPERSAPFEGAVTPADFATRALKPQEAVTTAETRQQHAIENARAYAEYQQNQQKFNLEYGPGTVDSQVEQVYHNPDTAVQNVPQTLRTAVQNGLQTKYGITFPKPLTGQQSEQEVASKSTLNAVNYIRSALDDPEIAGKIGPILGRLQDAQQKTGTAIGLSPAAAQKAQELRTQMRLLLTQEPREFGGRLTPALMDELQKSGPRVDMNIDMLKGALNGTEITSLNQLDNLDRARFGGQMRPRAVRGLEATPEIRNAIQGQKKGPGMYTMTDGSRWYLTSDGNIIPR